MYSRQRAGSPSRTRLKSPSNLLLARLSIYRLHIYRLDVSVFQSRRLSLVRSLSLPPPLPFSLEPVPTLLSRVIYTLF